MASSNEDDMQKVFDMYAKFDKTEAQLRQKDIRIDLKNIQKMMKDAGVTDSKYTTKILDNDIACVLGKLTSEGVYAKGTRKFEFRGFKQLIDQIAESKKISADQIIVHLINSNRLSPIATYLLDSISGRVDGIDAKNCGYISNYKGEGTYKKKH